MDQNNQLICGGANVFQRTVQFSCVHAGKNATQFQSGAGKFGLQRARVTADRGQVGSVDGALRIGEGLLQAAGRVAEFDNQASGVGAQLLEIKLIDVRGDAIRRLNQAYWRDPAGPPGRGPRRDSDSISNDAMTRLNWLGAEGM